MLVSTSTPQVSTLEDLLEPGVAAQLDRLDLLSRKVFAGKLPGERRSKRRGRSVEFEDYRPYVPGDDLRHLDWKIFARLDRFVLKIFREEQDLSLHVLLDASPSMLAAGGIDASERQSRPTSKLLWGARLAAALAYLGLANNNRVTVAAFGGGAGFERLAPMRGRRNTERVARFLIDRVRGAAAPAPGNPDADFEDAARRFARGTRDRGVVVLISDLLIPDSIESGLSYLSASGAGGPGFDAVCVQTLAPGEIDPSGERSRGLTGDLRLTDIETGRPAEVTVSRELLRAYHTRLESHLERIRTACRARQIQHILANTGEPPERMLLEGLRRRRLIG